MKKYSSYIIGGFALCVSMLISGCSSSDSASPAGTTVPGVYSIVAEGKTYTASKANSLCYQQGNSGYYMTIFLNSGSETVTASVMLSNKPTINKTYTIDSNFSTGATINEAKVVATFTSITNGVRSIESTSGTVQISIESGKVVAKFSNLPSKMLDQNFKQTGTTVMAGNFMCD